jgi:hypothetical protein
MTIQPTVDLQQLYEHGEVAWLDAMAAFAASGQVEKLDLVSLQDYLESGAERERREVRSRLRDLIVHHLRWEAQPELRTREWLGQIAQARMEFELFLDTPSLEQHANDGLEKAYSSAVELALIWLPKGQIHFPVRSPLSLAEWVELRLDFSQRELNPKLGVTRHA